MDTEQTNLSLEQEQTNLSLEQVLGILRRRVPWILLCVVLVAGAAYGVSKHQTKKYTATAALVFNNNQPGQQIAGLPAVSSASPQAQQSTNVKLVQLGDMAEKTAGLLGRGLTKEHVKADLSVSAQGESNVVDVSATATPPALAAVIANTYAEQFVTEQQNSSHAYYASALQLVTKQLSALSPKERAGTAGLTLQERAQSLATLAELHNGNVQVAQAATIPTSPSSPKTTRNTLIAAVLGLLLGLSVAFLLERFDRRIREPKDLQAIYGLPLLGAVPRSAALSRSAKSKSAAKGALPPSEAEAFRLIRAQLRSLNINREPRTLLVASAAPGDGKTTIACHLASETARMGSRVLLMELDLRHPTVAQQLDVQSGPGVSDLLVGAVSMSEATQTVNLDSPSTDGSGGRTLDVIVAGADLPSNPGELIESHAMEALLRRAKSVYELVVIDTPPLVVVSDAFPVLALVDGVIIVGRVGRNRRDVAARLRESLTGTDAPLVGIVANDVKASRSGPYGYGYDYTAPRAKRRPAAKVSVNGASSSSEESAPTQAGDRMTKPHGEAVDPSGHLG
jgi:capsular exopolysaccharide synthesis family protein